jgi:hypothetical protein
MICNLVQIAICINMRIYRQVQKKHMNKLTLPVNALLSVLQYRQYLTLTFMNFNSIQLLTERLNKA